MFESRWYILKDHENLAKFESKNEERTFLGYSSKTGHIELMYILSSKCVVESSNVIVDDQGSNSREVEDNDIFFLSKDH